ncbi:MAG: hypothetical protein AB202_04025 [Parcubacteria bacterium C7867-007]|nr:MAG: hypothetical protein AB202_04025 [Parcubacteria bacterium C7867-007]
MDWSTRRRSIVYAVIGSVIGVLLIIVGISIFYDTPTCMDKKQNQDETGIDCGGPCARACVADVKDAQVRFARAVSPAPTRTDVIAYVENPNANAYARGVRATVELYDVQRALLATRTVTFNLPAGAVLPIFVQGMLTSDIPVAQTFFTIDESSTQWTRTTIKPLFPSVKDVQWRTGDQPRVTATVVNPVAEILTNTQLIATVFDANNEAIAASRTLVGSLPSQGTAPIVFTWNVPFIREPARVEIIPITEVRVP